MPPFVVHLLALLHELSHGPATGTETGLFSEPNTGLLTLLGTLSAAQASEPVAAGRPCPAAFVGHLAQLLRFSAASLCGTPEFPDFAAPWQVRHVSPDEWQQLQRELGGAFAALRAVVVRGRLDEDRLNEALTALTHAATHTGALRFHIANVNSANPHGREQAG
ncbi:hypothetical protein MF271_13340 [Deinococcus sp. KNUC1210]|uniref:hypothetical protein n=1 Tax=Deinococcus sp. KNUC1210 TaxID=2917691 RepID=UPI001EF10280|nr:hypothetical protein [Deinococcus sp. KNUC1210]ULH14947.1 hypothetical protein MF271_13340 [Deinococcus sp. KNUC1210]